MTQPASSPSQSVEFSVVIPCYNGSEYLLRCLESIANQSYKPKEIIVVDDGSTDATPVICNDFAASHEDSFRCHRQENAGVSAARNKGIDLTSGNYLVFVDSDDELAPDALTHYAQSILEHPSCHWLIANNQWERDGRVKSREITLPPSRQTRFSLFLRKKLHLGNISNMCFSRTAFDDNKFPQDLRFGEDTVVFGILLARQDPVIVPHVTALAHRHAESLRNQATLDDLITSKVHDHIFDHALLPAEFSSLRSTHWAQNCRSISRRAYREKVYSVSAHWYQQMIIAKPSYLFDLGMFAKYLKAKWRTLFD